MRVYYECQRCTECCRWPGQVKLKDSDIAQMAALLELPEFEFIQRYTQLRPDRSGLALVNQPDGSCIFLDGVDCRVQAAKPVQCREFPNGWNFPGFEKICRAIPREVCDAEYAVLTGRSKPTADSNSAS